MAVTMQRVHHVGVIVTNIERSMSFYNRLFDQEPDIRTDVENSAGLSRQFGVGDEEGDAKVKIAFYHLDNTSFEIIEVVEPDTTLDQPEVYRAGAKHICFQVEDCDATYDRMVEEGYEFVSRPCHFDEDQPKLDGVKWAYFRDPDGNFLEIMEDPGKEGYVGREPRHGLEPG